MQRHRLASRTTEQLKIKGEGKWSSDAFMVYVRISVEDLQSVSRYSLVAKTRE